MHIDVLFFQIDTSQHRQTKVIFIYNIQTHRLKKKLLFYLHRHLFDIFSQLFHNC